MATLLADSVEYVHVDWTTPIDPADALPQFGFTTVRVPPAVVDLDDGEWDGSTARILVGDGTVVGRLPVGTVYVYARLAGVVEQPYRLAGSLKVT